LPGAVTNLTTNYTPGSSSLTATWAAPLTGYPVPTSYTVILGSAGGPSVTVSNFSYTFTNLTPGVEYSISVKATNTVGTGPLTSTPPVIISQLPSAPQGVTANLVTGTSNALISWVAPAQGAPAPTNYTVTSSPGGLTCTTSTLSCTFTSLTLGTTYTFSVTATNVVGTGPAGVSNALSTAPPISPPGTPTFPNPKANARTVQLSWRASPNCGPGCQYKVLVNGAKFSSTTLTHLQVTGMVPDTSYRFTVIASSSKGTSSPSAPSRVARAWLTVLGPRATLSPGHFLFSPNRAYHLSILPNGRLAVLQGTRTHWIDPGGPGTKLLFSATGNIEFLNGAGLAWSSHTRFAAPRLEVGNSGYLNIYSGSRLVWRTNGGLVKAPVTTTTVYHHPVTTTTVHHRPPVTTTTVPGIPIP
jgi:hypothetical protein